MAENIDLKIGAVFKEKLLYLHLPVIAQLIHGKAAVTEGGDQVSLAYKESACNRECYRHVYVLNLLSYN